MLTLDSAGNSIKGAIKALTRVTKNCSRGELEHVVILTSHTFSQLHLRIKKVYLYARSSRQQRFNFRHSSKKEAAVLFEQQNRVTSTHRSDEMIFKVDSSTNLHPRGLSAFHNRDCLP